jgi:hypothetical protein
MFTTRISRLLAPSALSLATLATFALPQAAQASTIYACVKPASGATRVVGAKAKCRRGEHKLSWNTSGPRGAQGTTGAQGAEGKAGANGTGATFEAAPIERVSLPPKTGTVVLSKVLPPGAYVLAAKTTLAADSTAKSFADVFCELVDQPGTNGLGESKSLDLSSWSGALGEKEPNEFQMNSPLVLEGSLSSSVTSTLSMFCVNVEGPVAKAVSSRMHALTVTSIN